MQTYEVDALMSDKGTGSKAVPASVESSVEKPRRTFDEWFAYWAGDTETRTQRRNLSQRSRDHLAAVLWDLRRENRENRKAGRVWRGPRMRM
jgi:hypothetical protein